jgi:uncharacterized membrane protein
MREKFYGITFTGWRGDIWLVQGFFHSHVFRILNHPRITMSVHEQFCNKFFVGLELSKLSNATHTGGILRNHIYGMTWRHMVGADFFHSHAFRMVNQPRITRSVRKQFPHQFSVGLGLSKLSNATHTGGILQNHIYGMTWRHMVGAGFFPSHVFRVLNHPRITRSVRKQFRNQVLNILFCSTGKKKWT